MSTEHVESLRKLAAEVGGLKAFEPGVREAIGNTNWTVLMQRLDEAEAALSRTTQAPVADGVREANGEGPSEICQIDVESVDDGVVIILHDGDTGWPAILDIQCAVELRDKLSVTLASSDPTPATEAGGAAMLAASPLPSSSGTGAGEIECHGLDTPERVCFYEQDFYVLSNFSSFSIMWEKSPREGLVRFDTSEAVYHWMKFKPNVPTMEQYRLMEEIRRAPSAHEAFKLAERNKHLRRPDWDDVKVDIMRDILRTKASQHEYVRRKLLATGDRELVENSWRDDFWGWGPNRDGKNMLGKLWMEIRAELRSAAPVSHGGGRGE